MKKLLVFLLVGLMIFSLFACGSESAASDTGDNAETQEETATEENSTEEATTEEATTEEIPDEEPEPEITKVKVGESIENDYFKMDIESMEIMDEYTFKTSDYASYSLYVEEGYKLLVVQGTIENVGKLVISDSSFVKTAVVNGDYIVDGYDVRLSFERDKNFEIDPYTEQRFDLYINIPKKLAEQYETATFTLGFKDDMSPITTTHQIDGTETTDATNWFEITN